jgi:type I restriction enzyme, S subunit
VICVTNITERGIVFDDYQRWISLQEYNKTYKHFTVERGDLLLASSGNSWGKVAEFDDAQTVILNTSTMRLNPARFGEVTNGFLRLLLQAEYLQTQLTVLLTGSCQPNFGPSHLDRLIVAFPVDLSEQLDILRFIKNVKAKLDALHSAYARQLELLAEYRAALIHECVTGQRRVGDT